MDIVSEINGEWFEWDERKARLNFAKHGVAFEEAAEVFVDLLCQGEEASVFGEARDAIIGSSGRRLLTVVYIERPKVRRIISARPATRAERERYARRGRN